MRISISKWSVEMWAWTMLNWVLLPYIIFGVLWVHRNHSRKMRRMADDLFDNLILHIVPWNVPALYRVWGTLL